MKHPLFAIAMMSLLFASCQKSVPHSVHAIVGATADSQKTDDDKKFEEVVTADKIDPVCKPAFLETNSSLQVVLEKTADFIKTQSAPLDEAGLKQSDLFAADIQSKAAVLIQELLNGNLAGCGDVKLADLRSKTDLALIALAEKSKKETEASRAARNRLQKDASKNADEEPLRDQTFKISKELATALTAEQKAKNVFFVDGVIDTSQEKYDQALRQAEKTVCILITAPQNPLLEGAIMKMVDVTYSASEAAPPATSAMTFTMLTRVTSGSEVLSISCRLASDMKFQTGAKQFKRAFGNLLMK